MRNPVLLGAAAAASAVLLLAGGGVALAQTTPAPTPTCAEALRVYFAASEAFDALPDTVPNPALPGLSKKAEDAQVVVADRQDKFDDAMGDVVAAGGALGTSPSAGTLDAELARLEAFTTPRAADVEARITAVRAALRAQADLASAKAAHVAAVKARQDAPVDVANPKLAQSAERDAMVDAQSAADDACEGQSGDPGPVVPGTDDDDDSGVQYASCAEATAAGAAPLNRGQLGYRAALDSDDDGVACELPDTDALPVGGAATGG